MQRVRSVSDSAAEGLMEAAYRLTQLVRRELRLRRPGGLSVSQVRALSVLARHDAASLADVAEHVGLGAPAASRLVDDLVRNGLVVRDVAAGDRRRLALSLTEPGRRVLRLAQSVARRPVASRIRRLSAAEQVEVSRAVAALRGILEVEREDRLPPGEFDDE